MTVADGALLAVLVLAGLLGWRQRVSWWAPFTLGLCVGVILLRVQAVRVAAWAAAEMRAGTPPPSHLYILRTSAVVQFTVQLGGAAIIGAVCQHAAGARQRLWREVLGEPPFVAVSKAGGALDAAVVACVLSCGALLLLAAMRFWMPLEATVARSAVILPLSKFLGLGLS